jgi:hypothetical protein
MKRQRSVEWQQERNYSSSEEENDRIGNRMNSGDVNHRKNSSNPSPSRDSSSVLAQLIAQTQQLSSSKFDNSRQLLSLMGVETEEKFDLDFFAIYLSINDSSEKLLSLRKFN